MPQSNLEKAESIFKIIAVLIAAYWSYYVFTYENITVPERDKIEKEHQQSIDALIKTEIKPVGVVERMSYFMLTVTIKNVSNIPEKFPVSYFNIYGETLEGYDSKRHYYYNPDFDSEDSSTDTYVYYHGGEYFHSGELLGRGAKLGPQSESMCTRIIAFPTGKYNALVVTSVVYQSKTDLDFDIDWNVDSASKKVSARVIRTDGGGSRAWNELHHWSDTYDYFVEAPVLLH